jgi:hypothetical protein
MKYLKHTLIAILFISLFFSCESTRTAIYDQYSYQKTIEIKVKANHLMDKATTPYSDNLNRIEELDLEIQKIVEYEKNKPNNEITYAMWQVLADKEKNLLVGFFKRWKEKEQLNAIFVEEAKIQIMQAMDLLIKYEGKKDKVAKDKLLQLISSN